VTGRYWQQRAACGRSMQPAAEVPSVQPRAAARPPSLSTNPVSSVDNASVPLCSLQPRRPRCTSRSCSSPCSNQPLIRAFVVFATPRSRPMDGSPCPLMAISTFRPLVVAPGHGLPADPRGTASPSGRETAPPSSSPPTAVATSISGGSPSRPRPRLPRPPSLSASRRRPSPTRSRPSPPTDASSSCADAVPSPACGCARPMEASGA